MIVKELIEKLQKYDMEKVVIIEDADTGWDLNIIEVKEDEVAISLSGDYSDEFNKEERMRRIGVYKNL